MSLLRKVLTCMAALFLMFTVPSATAYAQEVDIKTGAGSIEITNAEVGQTYTLYKIFDANVSADGKNIVYKTTKTNLNAGGVDGSQWFTVNASGEVTQKPALTAATLTEENFKKWALAYGTVVGTPTKATEQNLKFKNVPYGYYFVQSSLGAVLSVDSVNPTATIIDKNSTPSWDNGDNKPGKVIVLADGTKTTVNGVGLDEWINFDIGVNASNFNGTNRIWRYIVRDIMAPSMTMDPATIKVTVKDANGVTEIKPYDANTNKNGYKITYYDVTDFSKTAAFSDTKTRAFRITVPWSENQQPIYTTGAELHVTYKAKLDSKKADKVDYQNANLNTAQFSWKEGSDPVDDKDPDRHVPDKTTETYTTQISLFKFVMKNGVKTPLANAGFTLTGPSTMTLYVHGTKFTPASNGTYWMLNDGSYTTTDPNTAGVNKSLYKDVNQKYTKDTFTAARTQNTAQNNFFLFTPDDGIITYKGLGDGTYTITETIVPAGYNKIAPIKFTVKFDPATKTWKVSGVSGGTVTYDAATKTIKLDVENKTGTVLPATGGIGTTLFYTIGGMLVVGAGVLLVVRKRMSVAGN